jgi:AbrB family looped-hinge helix DNA binding protein
MHQHVLIIQKTLNKLINQIESDTTLVKKDEAGTPWPRDKGIGCCKVESIVSVDHRGQIVLPKETRDRLGIHGGDKLAVVSLGKDEQVCCISLIKAESFAEMVRDLLGPMMKEIMTK